jgi:hypothetical protein
MTRWILVLAAALAVGCEGSGGGHDGAGAEDAAAPAAPDAAGEVRASGEVPRSVGEAAIAGTWAREVTQTALTTLPVVGETTTRTTALHRLVVTAEVRDGSAALAVATTVCDLHIDNGTELVKTVVPDALVASLPVTEAPGTLTETPDGLAFAQPSAVELRGVRLADPAADPLPTSGDDPAVWDQDGDGHPGVTMRIAGLVDGEVYVVQRRTAAFTGAFVGAGADRIEGLVDWTDEQVILGADNPLLESGRRTRPAPPEESTFVMRRVEEGVTCESLRAQQAELF